jgi:hypothetical protein
MPQFPWAEQQDHPEALFSFGRGRSFSGIRVHAVFRVAAAARRGQTEAAAVSSNGMTETPLGSEGESVWARLLCHSFRRCTRPTVISHCHAGPTNASSPFFHLPPQLARSPPPPNARDKLTVETGSCYNTIACRFVLIPCVASDRGTNSTLPRGFCSCISAVRRPFPPPLPRPVVKR